MNIQNISTFICFLNLLHHMIIEDDLDVFNSLFVLFLYSENDNDPEEVHKYFW